MAQHVFWFGDSLKIWFGNVTYVVRVYTDDSYMAELFVNDVQVMSKLIIVDNSEATPLDLVNAAYAMSMNLYRACADAGQMSNVSYSNINGVISSLIELRHKSVEASGGN